ncbi:MAG: uroporphyrinogen-III synthase [Ignavibacteriaceae bacterium]
MNGKTIAILENRSADQMAELIMKYGGIPLLAPALAEVPDIDTDFINDLMTVWSLNKPDIFIFQTGTGTRALFAVIDLLNCTEKFRKVLEYAKIIARGPKPAAVLRSLNIRIDAIAKEPFTTVEVIAELDFSTLFGKKIVIQRYGETNMELNKILEEENCKITEIATYKWSLPVNKEPLLKLICALEKNEIDVTAFTSASQVNNLIDFAKTLGKEDSVKAGLNRTLIASIGPICSEAIYRKGLKVDIEAHPPKMGAFIAAIRNRFS